MLNIIIFESDKNYMLQNVDIINAALAYYDIDYRIHKFSGLNKEFRQIIDDDSIKKVYILGVDSDMNEVTIASLIRSRDNESIIVLTNVCNSSFNYDFYYGFMILAFLVYNDNFEERLSDVIRKAIKIIYDKKAFIFKYNYKVYRIPYNYINYIEKEPLIKRCIIHTINDDFYVVNSIDKLTKELGVFFLRTHQSCIVNVGNIEYVDLINNIIYFNNGDMTSLLTDKMKKEIVKYINDNNVKCF